MRVEISCEELHLKCLMWGECTGSLAGQGKELDWVLRKTCQAWYCGVCEGLSLLSGVGYCVKIMRAIPGKCQGYQNEKPDVTSNVRT